MGKLLTLISTFYIMVNGLLAIVSHPDDETFGCGGTLVKHVNMGVDTNVLCLTCDPPNRKTEFKAATDTLGVNSEIWMNQDIDNGTDLIHKIADHIDELRPKTVITHVPIDYHNEHKTCYNLVTEAIEWAAHTTIYDEAWQVERLLSMEINTLIPNPSVLVDISDFYDVKNAAINKYSSQLAKFPWGYYQSFNRKKAELRGAQSNVKYAEAFLEESLPRNGPFYGEKSTNLLV